jgi:uroporphyrinogen decarboxylase
MDVSEAMMHCFEEPQMVHRVLEKVIAFSIEYCKSYKAVGANGVVIAEPLAGLLSPELAEEFSAPYVKKIIDAVQDENFIVIYHNCGGSTIQTIDSILSTGASAYHFGNAIQMIDMLPHIPADKVVLGNISPAGEFVGGTPESMREAVLALLEECSDYPNYVISSGCDIPPKTKWENIDAFFNAVEEFYSKKSVAA